ncbi:MAG: hypothetical protein ACO1SX_01945 [Actinomycetota bacterium]
MQHQKSRRRFGIAAAGSLLALAASALIPPQVQAGNTLDAFAFQPRFGAPGAFIRVGWSRPRSVPSSYILGYVVWRGDLFSPLQRVAGIDTDARHSFTDSEATRNVTAFDGDPGSTDAGSRTVFQSVPGITPGEIYTYQVAAAYVNGLQDRDGDGEPDEGEFMSPLSMRTNYVTAIAPPQITQVDGQPVGGGGGGVLVDLTSFNVEWQQTPGADTYEIWVSRNPSFRGSKVRIKAGRTLPVNQGGALTESRTISIRKASYRRTRQLYVSVGARNSQDRLKPRPFGAIFSAPVAIQVEGAPPPPP